MEQLCTCCNAHIVILEGDNFGRRSKYHGKCECGSSIYIEIDENGKEYDYSKCV